MQVAPLRPNEAASLQALHELAVLDSAPEALFDALVQAAATTCGVPIALLSLIDRERQWFKAQVGLDGVAETPRTVSFCAHAVLGEEVFEIADAKQDARFADNPLVCGSPDVRFYAGVPLRLPSGETIGTLCVIDRVPRQLDAQQRHALCQFALAAVEALVYRSQARMAAQSHAQYRALVEDQSELVSLFNAEGTLTFVNRAYADAFGRPAQDLVGSKFYEHVPMAERAALRAHIDRVCKSELPVVGENQVLRFDGEARWMAWTNRALRDSSGQVTAVQSVGRDITERRQAEHSLADERRRIENILDGTHAGTWEWNVGSGECRVNEYWAGMLGYSLHELAPVSINAWWAMIHPEDLAQAESLLVVHFAQQSPMYECELRMRHRLGHWVWVLARGRVLSWKGPGKPDWMYGTHTDVTARKQAQDDQLRTLAAFERASRLAGVGAWELELKNNAIQWSSEVCRIHGVAPGYVPSLAEAVAFYTPESLPVIEAAVGDAIAGGPAYDLKLEIIRRDGQRRWVRAVGQAEFKDDQPWRLVGAFQDITEVQRIETNLLRSNADLEQFAHIASHDLQEPLRMVANYTELLASRYQGQLDEKADKYIHYAVDGARRMQTLVNDLLSYARVGAQAKPLLTVDSAAVLARVRSMLRASIEESGAVIEALDLPLVVADESQLVQLLQNLVGNAIKFRSAAAPHIRVAAVRNADGWQFSVSDNGIGLDPRFSERVFQMFQRLHERGKYPGSGIGMAIAKRIVERHEGRIWLESQIGKGTTFYFTLKPVPVPVPGV